MKYIRLSLGKVAICFLTIKSLYGLSAAFYNSYIDSVILVLAIVFSVIYFTKAQFMIKTFLVFSLTGCFFFVSCFIRGEWYLLITYLAILIIINEDIEEYIELIFKIHIVCLIINLILSAPMYSIDKELVCQYTDLGGERYRFLFTHPNTFSLILISAIFEWVWLNWEKIKFKNWVVITLIFLVAYIFTKTDAIPLFYIFLIVSRISNAFFGKIICLVTKIGIPIGLFMCYVFSFCYTKNLGILSTFVQYIDVLASRRIAIMAMVISMNKIKLFSTGMINYVGYNYKFSTFGVTDIDNAYISLIYNYGFIYIIVLAIVFYKLSLICEKRDLFLLSAFVIYSLIEGQVTICLIFPSLLLISRLFTNNIHKRRNK